MRLLNASAGLPLVAAALLSSCSIAGPHVVKREGSGETVAVKECDWGYGGNWLIQGQSPNSPFLPFHRGSTRTTSQKMLINVVFVGAPLLMDLVISPFTYATGRECSTVNTYTRYVPSSSEIAAQKKRDADAERERRLRESDEYKRRAAAEAAARAEREKAEAEKRRLAEALEREYPVLEEFPRAAGAPRPRDFALIVGIESYRSIPKADYGESDAKRMRGYLEALGVPSQNIVSLTGQSASKSDLVKYLEEWLPANVSPESRVYFFYSGHGAPDPQSGSAYLVPWDGDPSFPKSTAYPVAQLYASLEKLPAKEAVVMIDACFSGAGGRSVLAQGARPLVTVQEDAPAASGKISALTASGPDQIAGGLELRRQGLFSYYLMRGLSGAADANADKSVTLGELRDYLSAEVPKAARRSNREQTPRVSGNAALALY